MRKKYLKFTLILSNLFLLGCSQLNQVSEVDSIKSDPLSYKFKVQCVKGEKFKEYENGDLPCTRDNLKISAEEKLKIKYIISNKDSKDPYKHGYRELHRYRNGKLIEVIKLRKQDDPAWFRVPFVRVRKQKYLADLDNDGFLEFALYRFSPGSAIVGTVEIYSLKGKITFWGKGRYQFEGDTFVKLGCPDCSKFNPEACKKCY